jgi:hypothetical protein
MSHYDPSNPIAGDSLGSPERWVDYLHDEGAKRMADVEAYVRTVYRVAPQAGLAAHKLVAQAILETTQDGVPFASQAWVGSCNPAGIGVTSDAMRNWYDFKDGTTAALAHLVHVALYVLGTLPTVLEAHRSKDPRANAVGASILGKKKTLASFGGSRAANPTWATDPAYGEKWAAVLNRTEPVFAGVDTPTPPSPPAEDTGKAITFGRVPIYGYEDRYIANKRENFGWNDLGPRDIKFVTLHRMVGTLQGTDGWFRRSDVSSYTDFGLSTKLSDPGLTPGTIYLWNYPSGRRAPWASGPYQGAFGDGLAIAQKYGVNAVNRDGISLEIGGTNEPIDAAAWAEIVKFIAYWADQRKVPWTSFPINPATGISFVIWHTEFTAGTGKQCPFMWLRNRTPQLIEDVKQRLKQYQEGGAVVPPDVPTQPARQTMTLKTDLPIRQAPGFASPVIAWLDRGTTGTIIAGPQTKDGIAWYDVKVEGLGTGFVPATILSTLEIK